MVRKAYRENKLLLAERNFKICLVFDLWTSSNNFPFLAIKANKISKDFVFIAAVLDFTCLPYPHSGKDLGRAIAELTENLEIPDSILSVTVYNASYNATAFQELAVLFPELIHIHCASHVLNLWCVAGPVFLEIEICRLRKLMVQIGMTKAFQV